MRTFVKFCGFAGALLVSSGLSGCRTGRPDYTINVPPNVVAVRPPRSVLFVDTPVSLGGLNQALEQAVARGLPAGGGGGIRLGVLDARWRLVRGPAALRAAPPGIAIQMPLVGEVSIGAGFLRCQAGGIGGVFTIGLEPTLTADGALVLQRPRVAVAQQGAIACAGIQVPVGDLFTQMLRPTEQALGAVLAELKIPLGPALSRGLAELAVPRALAVGGQPACLDLDPQALVIAPLGAGPTGPTVRVGLDVAPRLSLGACPGRAAAAPRALSVRQEAGGGPSRVQVAVAIPAMELQAPLGTALVGKRFGGGTNQVQINSVAIGDAQGRVLVRLGVSGAYQGDLFLWGTPAVRLENGRYVLGVPDLQVASESTSRLQDLRLDLFQLFEGNLADKLRPQLTLDVTDRMQKMQQQLSGSLSVSRDTWQQAAGVVPGLGGLSALGLRSQLSELRPLAVESRPGLIVAYVELTGTVTLDIR